MQSFVLVMGSGELEPREKGKVRATSYKLQEVASLTGTLRAWTNAIFRNIFSLFPFPFSLFPFPFSLFPFPFPLFPSLSLAACSLRLSSQQHILRLIHPRRKIIIPTPVRVKFLNQFAMGGDDFGFIGIALQTENKQCFVPCR